jgi:cyclase
MNRGMVFAIAGLAGVLVAAVAAAPALVRGWLGPRDDIYHAWAEDTVFTVSEVRPGVYFATGRQGQVVGANSVFIVTDRDVIVVDDHITPTAARALIAEIRRVTPKPIRYVVNTHFHYDHTSGNGAFGPEVEILSHPATRARLVATGQQTIRQQLEGLPTQIATLRSRLDTTTAAAARAALEGQIRGFEQMERDYRELTIVLPTMTVDSSLVLYRGDGAGGGPGMQEIRVFFMGRGHTDGDVVVQLPRERLLLSGDLLTNTAGPPFLLDGYPGEWGNTLRRLARLDFTTTLPGHGGPVEGKDRYLATADFMDALWQQVGDLAHRGVPRDSIAPALNLSAFLAAFPALSRGLSPAAAQRAYDLVTGKVQ